MRKYDRLLIPFFFFLIISFFIFLIFKTPLAGTVSGLIEQAVHPVQRTLTRIFFGMHIRKNELDELRADNASMSVELKHMRELEKENQALHDQFQTASLQTHQLLPAQIVGLEHFIPGVANPDFLIIDKGSSDHVKKGQAVVSKNYLVGTIVGISAHSARVQLVTAKNATFTAKTAKTNANGVVHGLGDNEMVLANVVLSDKLEKDDLIVTANSVDAEGNGIPPDLLFGKVSNIDKKASNLFQSAEITSPVAVTKLREVFLIMP